MNRIGMVVALATSLVALAMALFCPALAPLRPILFGIALGAFILFVILAWLWESCEPKPCNWFLLVSAQAFYATGLLLINLAHCCPGLMWVGVAVGGVGILMMVGWALECKLSFCRVAIELGFITAGILIQILLIIVAVCGGSPGFVGEDADPIAATVFLIADAVGAFWILSGITCLAQHGGLDVDEQPAPAIVDRPPIE